MPGCRNPVRAAQALRAQKSAVETVKIGFERTEAALDAQMALLERLRLAFVQYQATDQERLTLEVEAVADQLCELSDDLESIHAAMAEAEAYSDRKLLADVEQAGRRALYLAQAQNDDLATPMDEDDGLLDEDELDGPSDERVPELSMSLKSNR